MTLIAATPDQKTIQGMFDRLSGRYDLFNRLTSLGLDALWRQKALSVVKPGMRVLDLGCGTGDLTLAAAKRLRGRGEAIGLDFSQNMLALAQKRAENQGLDIRFERRSAEEIPFEPKPYDAVVSGFVLRNIYENIDPILRGVYDSLRHGGAISFLDFTEPPGKTRKKFWQWYMNHIVAFYGRTLFGKDYPEFYMTDSAARFLKAPEFVKKLQTAGFENITTKKFMMGIIVLYQGNKP